MSDPSRIYKEASHASQITNLAADRANIAKLRTNVAEIDVLTVNTSISLPDGSLVINSSGAGEVLTTEPSGGILTNDAFSLKTLTSTGNTIAITSSNTEINLEVGPAGITTLASAGGTSIVTDGTGPSLEVKGQNTTPLLSISSTATTFGYDNILIRVADSANALPPTLNPASATAASSIAIGNSASATAASTVAVGDGAAAAVANAVAIGTAANANAANTVSIGVNSLAQSGIAIGDTAQTAGGPDSIAIGTTTNANPADSVALGPSAQVLNAQTGGVAIGWNASSNTAALGTGRGVAVGADVNVSGDTSAFVGNNVSCTVPTAGGFAFGDPGVSGTITQAEPGFLAARKAAGSQLTYAYEGQVISTHSGFMWHRWITPTVYLVGAVAPTAGTLMGRNHVLTVNPTTFTLPAVATVTALSSSWGEVANVTQVPGGNAHMFMISNRSGGPATLADAGSYSYFDNSSSAAVVGRTIADGNAYVFMISGNGDGTFNIELLGGFNPIVFV